MSAKLLLTIYAIIAVLFGLGFLLIPRALGAVYGMPPLPFAVLNARFFGSTLIALAVVNWFARDFRDWDAIRGVLIADVVGDVFGGAVNLWGTFRGVFGRNRLDDHADLRSAARRRSLLPPGWSCDERRSGAACAVSG